VTSTEPFALLVMLVAGVGLVAVLSNRVASRIKLPAPALFLVGAAIAAKVIPALHGPSQHAVEQVVTLALVCILFDGGMDIGWAGSGPPSARSP
jgi:potassium/hydrogen antiporter